MKKWCPGGFRKEWHADLHEGFDGRELQSHNLKANIQEREAAPPDQQGLTVAGEPLEGSRNLCRATV